MSNVLVWGGMDGKVRGKVWEASVTRLVVKTDFSGKRKETTNLGSVGIQGHVCGGGISGGSEVRSHP